MKNFFIFINCQTTVMKPFAGNNEWFSAIKKLYSPITIHKIIQNIVTNIVTTQISSKYPKSTGLFVNMQKFYLGWLQKINMVEDG